MTLLVLQQLLGRLQELVAHVALEHPRDEVDLQVALVHAARLAHKRAEHALEAWAQGRQSEPFLLWANAQQLAILNPFQFWVFFWLRVFHKAE